MNRYLYCAPLFVGLLTSFGLAQEPPREEPKPQKVSRFFAELQRVGDSYEKGSTMAATKLAQKKLVAQIDDEFNGRLVKFTTKVHGVTWKDGVAEVTTEAEFPTANERGKSSIQVMRSQPFELLMGEEDAAAIEPGDKVEFVGRLDFHPWRWGAVGRATKTQQMYNLRHQSLGPGYLGTFTTSEFAIELNGKEVVPKWKRDPAAERDG